MFMSSVNLPAVKYQAVVYSDEEKCMEALAGFLNNYERKSSTYKKDVVVDGHCISFNSFPISAFKNIKEI